MPATAADVSITHELLRRTTPAPDYLREKLALLDLAQQMAEDPEQLLPHLVQQAMEICEADSSGISVLEGDVFRWVGLAGKLACFEGATTPRNFSPCGVCIDYGNAILMERPERVYGWIADANITVPEVLLVPLMAGREPPIGTLWVVAKDGQHFNNSHERVMMELAAFTGLALRMVQSDRRLKEALEAQEILTKEMSHRIKNLFAVTESLVRMTSRSSGSKEEMTESLIGRIRALSEADSLVRRSSNDHAETLRVELRELIATILQPYRTPNLNGGDAALGQHAASSIALVLHELATNAAKYGALSVDGGQLDIDYAIENENLQLNWQEAGGPPAETPVKKGFGTSLVEHTVSSLDGTLDYDWSRNGLRVRIRIPWSELAR